MSTDGKVVIEVELKSDQVEGQLNELKNAFADLGGVGKVFGEISSLVGTFSNTFKGLSGVAGPVAAGVVAAVTTMITAFNKLYEASKQNFFENFKKYDQVLQSITGEITGALKEVWDSLANIGGVSTSISDVVDEFASYNLVMQEVKAISGATEDEFQQLLDLTAKLGRETQFTATDAAEG
ncbi:MAG: hypothetical protein ACLSAJ_10280 [Intestinibacter bartlettii]|uniref:hypothetical protein n=1 Tax=Intestinibacter bartlettii TaxID=261299 RepID=UPI0039959DD4